MEGSQPSPPTAHVPWRRLLLEGLVIVASILLAFAIDAWWDTTRDEAAIRRQLEVLRADMEANRSDLERSAAQMRFALAAQVELVDRLGPDPAAMESDSLVQLLGTSFSYAGYGLELGSVEALLGSSEFDSAERPPLYRFLLRFRSESAYFRENLNILRDLRETTYAYLVTVAPMAHVTGSSPAHGPSRFPFPTESLLTDAQLQGMLGNLAIRTWNVTNSIDRLIAVTDSIQGFLVTRCC